jgi:hypothetical protein
MARKVPDRMVVYIRDIRNITGKSRSSAQRMLQHVRIEHNKLPRELVSIQEFCATYGLNFEDVKDYFKD